MACTATTKMRSASTMASRISTRWRSAGGRSHSRLLILGAGSLLAILDIPESDGKSASHWEGNFQGRPPAARGDLGDLDGNVGIFDFSTKLVSPKRYPVWQDYGGTLRQETERGS